MCVFFGTDPLCAFGSPGFQMEMFYATPALQNRRGKEKAHNNNNKKIPARPDKWLHLDMGDLNGRAREAQRTTGAPRPRASRRAGGVSPPPLSVLLGVQLLRVTRTDALPSRCVCVCHSLRCCHCAALTCSTAITVM